MKLENDVCPNNKCKKLIDPENHISIGGVCYCDEVCFEEWAFQVYGWEKEDKTTPFLK